MSEESARITRGKQACFRMLSPSKLFLFKNNNYELKRIKFLVLSKPYLWAIICTKRLI